MIIILDSSVVCSDFQMKGSNFHLLGDYLNKTKSQLVYPEIVIDEVKNKYKENVIKQKNELEKAYSSLGKLSVKGIKTLIESDFVEKLAKEYNKYFDDKIVESNAIIEHYPKISHKKVVQRALSRKKPFNENGQTGYRDYLIWESVINVLKRNMEQVIFITLNTKDFCSEDRLHNELLEDLNKKHIGIDRLVFYDSLKKFIDKQVVPQLEEIKELEMIKEKLENSEYQDIDFSNLIQNELEKLIVGTELDTEKIHMMSQYENPTVTDIVDINSIDILGIKKLHTGELFINAYLNVECGFEFFIYKADYYCMVGKKFIVLDSDWNEHYIWATDSMEILIEIDFVLDTNAKEITSSEVIGIECDEDNNYAISYRDRLRIQDENNF